MRDESKTGVEMEAGCEITEFLMHGMRDKKTLLRERDLFILTGALRDNF